MSGKIHLLFLILFSTLNGLLFAQFSVPGTPVSIKENWNLPTAIVELHLDSQAIDHQETNNKTLRFAWPIATSISFAHEAEERESSSGQWVQRLGIKAIGAKSIYLEISNFHLSEGDEFYVYSENRAYVLGAFTAYNNNAQHLITIQPVPGELIYLEMVRNRIEKPDFTIERVYYDFLGVHGFFKDAYYGSSGDCEVDIKCWEGNDWQREKRAVCRILSSGQLCTGTLVNNTREDARPFILTANHCINTADQAHNSIYFFNYESESCYGPDGSVLQSLSGSELRATTYHLDFTLTELFASIPPSFNPYFAGINFSDEHDGPYTVIHHPQGDVKKISRDFGPITTANYGGGYDFNSHWKVAKWDVGTTEGGSSGSPIFDDRHRIVGTLTGGEATCTHLINDYFSKINLAWDEYPGITQQLRYWLDPDMLNVTELRGYAPYEYAMAPVALLPTARTKHLTNHPIDIQSISTGNPDHFSWLINGESYSSENLRNIYFSESGKYDCKLIVSNANGSDEVIGYNYFDVYDECFEKRSPLLSLRFVGLEKVEGGGYWTGSNPNGYTEFADKHILPEGEYWVHRIRFTPGKLITTSPTSTLMIRVWDGGSFPQAILHSQNFSLDALAINQEFEYNLPIPVLVKGNFFLGFGISLAATDTFAMKHSTFGNVSDPTLSNYSSLMIKDISGWKHLMSLNPTFRSSLMVEADLCESINQVEEQAIQKSNLNVYPNPANEEIFVEVPNLKGKSRLTIVGVSGIEMDSRSLKMGTATTIQLKIKSLPIGIYLIRIQDEQFVYQTKWVKL